MYKKYYIFLILIFTASFLQSQIFKKAETTFVGVMQPVATWIDYGKTQKQKAYLAGEYYSNNNHIVVSQTNTYYHKNKFKNVKTNLPALYRGDAASADFDNDGDEDIIITGITSNNQLLMRLYRNDGRGLFVPINQNFAPVSDGSVEWGDFDNDDDLDILVTGKLFNNQLQTSIYRNDNGVFTKTDPPIIGVYNGNATWHDFDNDNDLDVLITGNAGGKPITAVYKNNNSNYSMVAQQFIPLMNSACAWGDFNNDKKVDFIVSGETGGGYPVCMIYQNQSGSFFNEVAVSIRPLMNCSIDLGDFDNDNDIDIIMTGESLERSYTNIYENKLGFKFENVIAGLPGVTDGTALWGDFDKDGDLDILLAGLTICYDFIGDIYINTSDPPKKKINDNNIFIEAPMPKANLGPFYYYVFSSCYCDPTGGTNNAYHMYVSNVHLQHKRYELNYKYNDLLIKQVPNWGKTDRGHRTSNGFETRKEANISRKQVIESYKSTNYTIHELNW